MKIKNHVQAGIVLLALAVSLTLVPELTAHLRTESTHH